MRFRSMLPLLLVAAPAAAQQQPVAFVDVNVVPMVGERLLQRQTVVVRDGKIEAVGPAASTAVPADAIRVDGSGKYLIPGLAEMHGHVPGLAQDGANRQLVEDVLFLYVAAGALTVRGMQGHPSHLQMRERINAGELIGPRFWVGAPQLAGNNTPTPDSARTKVRAYKEAGYDLLKIQEGLSREVYDAIVEEARAVDMPFGGHVPDAVGLHAAIAARQSTVDHLDNYILAMEPDDSPLRAASPQERNARIALVADESRIPALAADMREANIAVVPTMALWATIRGARPVEELSALPELRYMPRNAVQNWTNSVNQIRGNAIPEAAAREVELRKRILKALNDAGVTILMGTDAPQLFSVPGFSLYNELEIMAEAGMTPYEILQSGTVNVARFFGIMEEAGTIEPGKRADLILLEANPLQNISAVRQNAGVVVGGRWLSGEEIQRRLEAIAARSAN